MFFLYTTNLLIETLRLVKVHNNQNKRWQLYLFLTDKKQRISFFIPPYKGFHFWKIITTTPITSNMLLILLDLYPATN